MSKTSLHSFYPSPINTFPIHANSGLRCDMPIDLSPIGPLFSAAGKCL